MQEIIKLVIYLVYVFIINYIFYKLDCNRNKKEIRKKLNENIPTYNFIIEVEFLNEKNEYQKQKYIAHNMQCKNIDEFIKTKKYKKFKNTDLEEMKRLGYKIISYNVTKSKKHYPFEEEFGGLDLWGRRRYYLTYYGEDENKSLRYIKI